MNFNSDIKNMLIIKKMYSSLNCIFKIFFNILKMCPNLDLKCLPDPPKDCEHVMCPM